MNAYTTAGAIAWPELQTSDREAAVAFYAAVLGWDSQDMPMPDGRIYTVSKAGDYMAAGMMTRVMEEMPPVWMYYVSVADAAATAERVKELGGSVFVEPMDIPQTGTMVGIADPQGAMIFAMQWASTDMPAPDFTDAFTTPGAFSWFQLQTPDTDAAQAFYGELFGWNFQTENMHAGPYTSIQVGEVGIGGIIPPFEGVPAHWGAYVTVADADAAAQAVTENGGTVVAGPFDIPTVGRTFAFQDPQGANLMAIAYLTGA